MNRRIRRKKAKALMSEALGSAAVITMLAGLQGSAILSGIDRVRINQEMVRENAIFCSALEKLNRLGFARMRRDFGGAR